MSVYLRVVVEIPYDNYALPDEHAYPGCTSLAEAAAYDAMLFNNGDFDFGDLMGMADDNSAISAEVVER